MEFSGAQPDVDLTYSDVFLVPRHSEVGSRLAVDLAPGDGSGATLPLVASNMNSVTGPRLAATLARRGGLGVLPQDLALPRLVEAVQWVKAQPVAWDAALVFPPSATVADARKVLPPVAGRGIVVADQREDGTVPLEGYRGSSRLRAWPPRSPMPPSATSPARTRNRWRSGGSAIRTRCSSSSARPTSSRSSTATASSAPCPRAARCATRSTARGSTPTAGSSSRPRWGSTATSPGRRARSPRRGSTSSSSTRARSPGADAASAPRGRRARPRHPDRGRQHRHRRRRARSDRGGSLDPQGRRRAGRDVHDAHDDGCRAAPVLGGARDGRGRSGGRGARVGGRRGALSARCRSGARRGGRLGDDRVVVRRDHRVPGLLRTDDDGRIYKESWGMASTKAVQGRFQGLDAFERARKELFAEGISSSRIYLDPQRPGVEDLLDMITSGVRSSFTYAGAATVAQFPRPRAGRTAVGRRLRGGQGAAGQLVIDAVTSASRVIHAPNWTERSRSSPVGSARRRGSAGTPRRGASPTARRRCGGRGGARDRRPRRPSGRPRRRGSGPGCRRTGRRPRPRPRGRGPHPRRTIGPPRAESLRRASGRRGRGRAPIATPWLYVHRSGRTAPCSMPSRTRPCGDRRGSPRSSR